MISHSRRPCKREVEKMRKKQDTKKIAPLGFDPRTFGL